MQGDSLPADPQGKPKTTGVGSLALLQRISSGSQELNSGLLCCRRTLYRLSHREALEHTAGRRSARVEAPSGDAAPIVLLKPVTTAAAWSSRKFPHTDEMIHSPLRKRGDPNQGSPNGGSLKHWSTGLLTGFLFTRGLRRATRKGFMLFVEGLLGTFGACGELASLPGLWPKVSPACVNRTGLPHCLPRSGGNTPSISQ